MAAAVDVLVVLGRVEPGMSWAAAVEQKGRARPLASYRASRRALLVCAAGTDSGCDGEGMAAAAAAVWQCGCVLAGESCAAGEGWGCVLSAVVGANHDVCTELRCASHQQRQQRDSRAET